MLIIEGRLLDNIRLLQRSILGHIFTELFSLIYFLKVEEIVQHLLRTKNGNFEILYFLRLFTGLIWLLSKMKFRKGALIGRVGLLR